MESEDNQKYRILEAYRDKSEDFLSNLLLGGGASGLVAGAAVDETSLAIVGATLTGVSCFRKGQEYIKAYSEARLDYLENNEYTRLKR